MKTGHFKRDFYFSICLIICSVILASFSRGNDGSFDSSNILFIVSTLGLTIGATIFFWTLIIRDTLWFIVNTPGLIKYLFIDFLFFYRRKKKCKELEDRLKKDDVLLEKLAEIEKDKSLPQLEANEKIIALSDEYNKNN